MKAVSQNLFLHTLLRQGGQGGGFYISNSTHVAFYTHVVFYEISLYGNNASVGRVNNQSWGEAWPHCCLEHFLIEPCMCASLEVE